MTVSLCVIARNEEEVLPCLLEDIKKQTYNHKDMEIILVDSLSEDRTRAIMDKFRSDNPDFLRVSIFENHIGNQAGGWNAAIRNASGEILIRVDAHSSIPEDFVEKNVRCIESGEAVVGGRRPCISKECSPWSRTLLLAESSMFGSSIAVFRRSGRKGYVKSVFHPAYRREVFDEVGLFHEYLGRTEDNEMSYRIRKAGYKICFDPDIVSYQYSRSSLKGMLKQKFGNGYWIGLTSGVCPKCLSVYHFVPFCFVSGMAVTSALAACKIKWPRKLFWGAYAAVNVLMSVTAVYKEKKYRQQALLPVIFFLLHISYGLGTFIGLLKMPNWRKGIVK